MSSSRKKNKGKDKRKARVKRRQEGARQAMSRIVAPVKASMRNSRTLNQRAVRAWDAGDYDAALKLFEQDQRKRPGQVEPLLDLGKSYGLRYDYPRAEQCLEKALKLSGANPACLGMVGEIYHAFSQFDRAEDYLCKALEAGGDSARASVELATICERLHRLDEACAHIECALAAEPDHPKARLVQAKLARRSGDSTRAESFLRDLLAMPDSDHHWEASYALGAILDKEGYYDGAMEALVEGKQWHRGRAPTKLARAQAGNVLARNQRLMETITPDHFQRWNSAEVASSGEGRAIALLCGHARSGTTLIEQVLDSHEDLVSSDETQIMSDDVYLALARRSPTELSVPEMLDGLPDEQMADARERYFQLSETFLREPIGARILLDKNPELTLLIPVIARVFPEVRIIFALRDPRDVCLSCFMQALPMNSVSVSYLTLEETCRKYATVMKSWLALRPMLTCRWTETRYEDNVADLEGEARRLLEFLGLSWDDKVLKFYEHARQKHVRSPTYEAVTKPVYSGAVGRWRHYQKFFEPHLEVLAPFVREFGYEE